MVRSRVAVVATMAALALTLGLSQPAHALTKTNKGWVARSAELCVWDEATASHGPTNMGQALGVTKSYTRLYVPVWKQWIWCGLYYSRPPGNIATSVNWMKWNGYSWVNCYYTGFRYNSVTTYIYSVGVNFPWPWCGNGYYLTVASSWVYNNGWQGGGTWSPYIWVQSPYSQAVDEEPPSPEWANPDGTVDAEKLPADLRATFTPPSGEGTPDPAQPSQVYLDEEGNLVETTILDAA